MEPHRLATDRLSSKKGSQCLTGNKNMTRKNSLITDEMVDAVIIGLGLEEDIGDALAREDVKRVLELMFGWFANAMEAGRMQEAARHR